MARKTEVTTPETPAVDAPVEDKPKKEKPVLTAETASWVRANARPAVSPCLCGCGGETKTRFVPGHDAKLKSLLTATIAAGGPAAADAQAAQDTFGW